MFRQDALAGQGALPARVPSRWKTEFGRCVSNVGVSRTGTASGEEARDGAGVDQDLERNEALDLEVYCLATLYILGPAFVRSLPERAAALARRVDAPARVDPAPTFSMPRRRGWVDRWRG